MKTLVVFLLISLLLAAVIVLDSHRLDAAGWLAAFAVASLFVIAHDDAAPRRPPAGVVRSSGSRANCSAAWAEPKTCVLCAGLAS